ncbi:hypothetical protein CBOM_05665 [Ceraceosorus bombacis]|uniref:Uncharacterized protein n=1 Tax=Ceraceosorus bombacis TaxID=401625 RepID=A0A0P1BSM8_9BASI|nr:hypothetical protein CBOM_05665 [Ceraceosorus bombacis]
MSKIVRKKWEETWSSFKDRVKSIRTKRLITLDDKKELGQLETQLRSVYQEEVASNVALSSKFETLKKEFEALRAELAASTKAHKAWAAKMNAQHAHEIASLKGTIAAQANKIGSLQADSKPLPEGSKSFTDFNDLELHDAKKVADVPFEEIMSAFKDHAERKQSESTNSKKPSLD